MFKHHAQSRPALIQAVSVVATIAALALADPARAQDLPGPDTEVDWGDIPESQLHMTGFPDDTTAAAVILADYGEVTFRDDRYVIYDRHRRVKILSEAGYDWGTVSITYNADGRTQRIRAINGQTFTVDESGDVERHKMDKDAVFTEEIDGTYERVRFTLPALEPGAVIEYRYQLISDGPNYVPDWRFQHSEPTVWSEFVLENPAVYQYAVRLVGSHPFAVESSEQIRNGAEIRTRWAMRDVPALREEVYMTTPNDYRAAIQLQLSSYMSSVGWADFLASWEEVAAELRTHPRFGDQLRASRAVRSQVETVIAGADTPRDKMERIHDFVRTSVAWDGTEGFLPSDDLSDVLETKSGDRPEINMLLAAMLREAGLDANPVLISTRSHGRPVEQYPILQQFNSLIVAVDFPRTRVLLDATDQMRPYDVLPADALNGRGWLVTDSGQEWIPIGVESAYEHTILIDGALDESGALTATMQSSSGGYAAVGIRHGLTDAESTEDFVTESLLEDLPEITIDSTFVTGLDTVSNDLRVDAVFTAPGFAQSAGDFLFFTPILSERFAENPLKKPERTFAVDTSFPMNISYTFRLRLPEGWGADELPRTVLSRLPLDGGFYRRAMEFEDGVLTVQTSFRIDRTLFEARLYQDLRTFFENVVAAQNEQVMLTRLPEPEPAPEPLEPAAGESGDTN